MSQRLVVSMYFLALCFISSATEWHVTIKGSDQNPGTIQQPFRTINKGAQVAQAGDTITVHAGVYREWVQPRRGGLGDDKRITYRAAPGETVFIKGSEQITTWKRVGKDLWQVTLPNSFFGAYNPYQDSIHGDWFNNKGQLFHTGEVFINNKPLPEQHNLGALNKVDGWFCQSDAATTSIWLRSTTDPNKQLTEINVRPTCFYPLEPGINFLTISGFNFSQAATQWAAPTAEQVGMVATHWCKGWIIENNRISSSKCVGITLGKERSTGHNVWSADTASLNRDGNIHYIEVVFRTLRNGWSKEKVGSHTVRNNVIYNCGQAGICGSMGAAFSTIEGNHIYDTWTDRRYDGAEIAGIKFHGAIDAVIAGNRLHNCGRGLWLDWMTQGTRVTRNLLYDNSNEDFFIEVNHGPYVVDNNISLSATSVRCQSQGGAYVHNLFAGAIFVYPDLERFTPYFLPHSTNIAGLATIWGGDDRWYYNVFVGTQDPKAIHPDFHGLKDYDKARFPPSIRRNVYLGGATPSTKDSLQIVIAKNLQWQMEEVGGKLLLQLNVDSVWAVQSVPITNSTAFSLTRVSKQKFESADGRPIFFDYDFWGQQRSEINNVLGPFFRLVTGINQFRIW